MKTLAKHALLLAGLVLATVATGPAVGQDDDPAKKQNTAGAAPAAQAAETPPKPVFAENAPVCPIETLTKVSIPNTTIHSAVLNEADGSCRVTATVTHPPSGDRVKVFIALPMKGWNGRFLGTGGGGFMGGAPSALSGPSRLGYATGATDTGHEGGHPETPYRPIT